MKIEALFSLVKGISSDEQRKVKDKLSELLSMKESVNLRLYQKLVKAKGWSRRLGEECRGMFKCRASYARSRDYIGTHLLETVGKLRARFNPAYNYDFPIEQAMLAYVEKPFVADVKELLEEENYPLVTIMLEKAENAMRHLGRSGGLSDIKTLPESSIVRSWQIEILQLKNAIAQVRKGFKLRMAQRIEIAAQIQEQFKDLSPSVPKAKRLHLRLQAGFHLLAGRVEMAGEYGVQSLQAYFEVADRNVREALDEFSFVVPLLIGLGKREVATRFVMQLGKLQVKGGWEEGFRSKLEIENLISMAVAFNNLEMADKARELLREPQLAIDMTLQSKCLYGVGFTYFMAGKYAEANRILSNDLLRIKKGDSNILWLIDCLKMLRFFLDNEDDITLRMALKLKRKAKGMASEYCEMLCDLVEDISQKPLEDRRPRSKYWLLRVEEVEGKPDNARFRQDFDLALFLRAYINQTTMADIIKPSDGLLFRLAH